MPRAKPPDLRLSPGRIHKGWSVCLVSNSGSKLSVVSRNNGSRPGEVCTGSSLWDNFGRALKLRFRCRFRLRLNLDLNSSSSRDNLDKADEVSGMPDPTER